MFQNMTRWFDSPFWGRGFRPFFFLGALHSVISLGIWAGFYSGTVTPPGFLLDPILWHAHEMIFGFAVAIVAGFLLTAVANWTGWLPVRKGHLAFLCLLWIMGRVAVSYDLGLPVWSIAVISGLFVPALAVSLAVPLLKTWNKRNFIFLTLLMLIFACDMAFILTNERTALYVALMVIIAMVSLVGGRIIPAFTVATLRYQGVVAYQTDQQKIDFAALISLLVVTVLIVFERETALLAIAAFASSAIHLFRMRHYHTRQAIRDPMLWILHFGYGWLVIGLFLLGLAGLKLVLLPTAIHALTVGCIGSMILGMMPRVTLGHTGRLMQASKITTLSFVLIQIAAIARIFAPVFMPAYTVQWIIGSALLWSLCFAMYLYVYVPMLFSPRPDGERA